MDHLTATEKRKLVRAKYSEIIGRNDYSQAKRDYCFKPDSNGRYFSDCSSSVSYSYREALGKENSFGILNTVGMYNCKKFTIVPVTISKGQIMNPEILRIGDMLLFAGTDTGRASSGYVGHVEMYWGYDSNGVHWLYGHGSGKPKKTKMADKCKSRYNSKTSTKVGNKGLIRVMRFIQDDDVAPVTPVAPTGTKVKITGKTVNVRQSAGTNAALFKPARYVYRGEIYEFTETKNVGGVVWYHIKNGWISGKYAEVSK